MRPNVITVYDFVFGAQFCIEKICQQKQTRPKSLAYLKSFEPIFQGNFAHHEPIDVTPEMTFENRLEKFVDFAFFALHLELYPAIDQVLHASDHIISGGNGFDGKAKADSLDAPLVKNLLCDHQPPSPGLQWIIEISEAAVPVIFEGTTTKLLEIARRQNDLNNPPGAALFAKYR